MSAQSSAEARYPLLTVNGRDEKAWAKRILYRNDLRDKTLLPIQVQFAKQAMNVTDEGETHV